MHSAILVVGENVEEQLAKYEECLVLPMHLTVTREQIIKYERERINFYKENTYAEYLKDPKAYAEKYDSRHVDYVANEFPKKLQWTDEECYNEFVRVWAPREDEVNPRCEFHEDGSLWTTYNDKAIWDWWVIGGRFRGNLILKEGALPLRPLAESFRNDWKEDYKLIRQGRCDQAYKKDIANWMDENFGFYGVLRNGEYQGRCDDSMFVFSQEMSDEEWDAKFAELVADVGDDEVITIVDIHD